MKAKQVTYERLKSEGYSNEKIGVVIEVEENESEEEVFKKAKEIVAKQFGEEVKEFYRVSARCKNCGSIFGSYGKTFIIPYKTELEEYPCPECGTKNLTRD